MKVLVVSFREPFKFLNSKIKVLVVPFRETFPSTDCFQLNRYKYVYFVKINQGC